MEEENGEGITRERNERKERGEKVVIMEREFGRRKREAEGKRTQRRKNQF